MRRSRSLLQLFGLFLMMVLVLALASACAKTALGKAIQSADVQKKLVETAAVEFIKLHLKGDPRITDAVYAQGKAAYQKYYTTQLTLATALASWQTVASPGNEATLTAALTEVTKNINVYLDFVGQFVNVNALKQKLSAGPGQPVLALSTLELRALADDSVRTAAADLAAGRR